MEKWYPLGPAQLDMALAQMMTGASAGFNLPICTELPPGTDLDLFQRALLRLIHESHALRTKLEFEGETIRQCFPAHAAPQVERLDLSGRPDPQAAVRDYLALEGGRPFELSGEPLNRHCLISLTRDRHLWFWCLHHLIIDAWGVSLLLQRICAIYDALAKGREPQPCAFSHPGELAALAARVEPGELWRSRLKNLPRPLFGSAPSDTSAHSLIFSLPRALHQDLAGLAHDLGVGTSRLYVSLMATLVARSHGRGELLVGLTFLNRPNPALLACPGMMTSELPLRLDLPGDTPFSQIVKDVSLEVSALKQGPQASMADLRGLAGLEPGRGLMDLAVSYVRGNIHVPMAGGMTYTKKLLPGHCLQALALNVNQFDTDSDLQFNLEAQKRFFDQDEAAAFWPRLQALCQNVLKNPDAPMGRLNILPQNERKLVMETWASSPALPVKDRSLYEMFQGWARQNLESTAAIHRDRRASYRQLDELAKRVAAGLAGLGVGPNDVVGICTEASIPMVAAYLGISRAGAAVVPLPPELPDARRAGMATDAGLSALVVHGQAPPPGCVHLPILDLDELPPAASAPPPPTPDPDALAYIIFTSGTSGRPKGVMIRNEAIVHKCLYHRDVVAAPGTDPVMLSFAQSFDPFFTQLMAGLISHRGLYIMDSGQRLEPEQFWAAARACRSSGVFMVPSLLEALLPSAPQGLEPARVCLGGEELPPRLLDRVRQQFPRAQVLNIYGPTEATVVCVSNEVHPQDEHRKRLPIGRPDPGYTIRILDNYLQPVPPGVAGELYIGGSFLAQGYRGRPGLTAKAFVPDPYSERPGARLYRTGDKASWRFDGRIDYLGRLDEQIKVAGVRIEPGDVEAALCSHPAVAQAVAMVEEASAGVKRLVAYLAPTHADSPPGAGQLLSHLQELLPAAMIPAVFRIVDAIPLSPSGKVDRRALAGSCARQLPADHAAQAPATELERAVGSIWGQVLGLAAIDVERSFFQAGGTSLLLITLHRRLGELPGYALSLPQLMSRPTVRGIAAQLDAGGGDQVLSQVMDLLVQVIGLKDIAPDDSLAGQGCDSLALAQLLSRFKKTFGVNLKVGELLKNPTPRALAKLAQRAKD